MEFDRVLYVPIIDKILKESDLGAVSARNVRKLLQKELGYDIGDQKSEIKELIKERFELILEETGPDNVPPVKRDLSPSTNGHKEVKKEETGTASVKKRKSVADPSLDDDARLAAKLQAEWNSQDRPSRSTVTKRKVTIPRKKKKAANASDESGAEGVVEKKKRKINPNNPFHAKLILSPQLSALLGGETELSRPETVKRIWAYIKSHDLQDKDDKRYIVCDENLNTVFSSSKVHMFTMNKLLSQHLYPADGITSVKTEHLKTEDIGVSSPFSTQDSPASFESDVHSSQVGA